MKTLKKISTFLMAVVLCFSITSCKKNKDDNSKLLVGRWSYLTSSAAMVLEIREDNTFSSSSIVEIGDQSVEKGAWSADDDEINFVAENNNSVVYKYVVSDNELTISKDGVDYVMNRLVVNPNVVGNWEVSVVNSVVKPLKDELVLPGGTVDGQEIPMSIPVENIQGDFIDMAVNNFLANLTITETELQYNIINENGEQISMTKNYSMNDFYMNITGTVLDYDVNVTFPIFESREAKRITFFLQKDAVADMFVGFANLLIGSGIGQGGGAEDIESFRQAFNETFEKFSVIVVMTPRN